MTRVDLLWLAEYLERHGGSITVPTRSGWDGITVVTTKGVLAAIGDSVDGEGTAPWLDGTTERLLDTFGANDPGFDAAEAAVLVERLLPALNERESEIIRRSFGIDADPAPYWAIGEDLGISKERVRQIRDDALEKMRRIAMRRCTA